MKKLYSLLLTALLCIVPLATQAQALKIATGSTTGTYSIMFHELMKACAPSIGETLQEQNTNGSLTNIDLLTNNQVNGAIVQGDVLVFRAKADPNFQNQVRVVFPMHREEIHILVRADGQHEGGFALGGFHVGGKQVVLTDVRDLANRKVGAVGGSVLTAHVLADNSGIPFDVVEYKNNDELLAALQGNQVDAALMVMGAPSPQIQQLSADYRLLPVYLPNQKAGSVYAPTELSYANLTNSQSVPSLSIQAVFVAQNYKSPQMLAAFNKLRACKEQNLENIQETLGNHAKWRQVTNTPTAWWPMLGQ
jgi:uncharacterized protein